MFLDFIASFREVLLAGTVSQIFCTRLPFGDVYPSLLVHLQLIALANFSL